MKHSNEVTVRRGAAIAIISMAMSLMACQAPGPTVMATQTLTISFTGGCATSVSKMDLQVNKNDKIKWQSGGGYRYRIWFMPFKNGRPLKSNGQGKLGPLMFDTGAPSGTPVNPIPNKPGVTYKYVVETLTAQGKPKPECKPLDPHIRIG